VVKQFLKNTGMKVLHGVLDTLMIVVPFLEITEVIAVIPVEYLPWYMLSTVLLRRLLRVLENRLNAKISDVV
jgi:hypothetical protein